MSINSPLGTRSPFSPRLRQKISKTNLSFSQKKPKFSVSGRSVQGTQAILKSSLYNVEKFGHTLPVIITEALTFSDRSTVVSVKISDCGYAWIVCGRRLLIWEFRHTTLNNTLTNSGSPFPRKTMSGTTQYFELMLPQSDLAHKADLVCIFTISGNHMPSCIAVSPEGVIRYWPNIAHEGVSVEITADLQGQECDSLCTIEGLGCILATTTCTVVLVRPHVIAGGHHSLQCHTLRIPTGWLGGISKKMSSLIFGPMSAEHTGETRLVRVLNVKQKDGLWCILVLAGYTLQKWLISSEESEQLLYIAELSRVIRDAYQCVAWESCGSNPADIDLWLLDIQVIDNSVMILAAAVNLHVSPQVQYALVRFDTQTKESVTQIEEFLLLKLYGLYQEDNMADFLSYRLLLCDSRIFIYRHRDITIIQQAYEPDLLDFSSIGDCLLGGSVCSNIPVFFSKNHGLIAVYSNDDIGLDQSRDVTDLGDLGVSHSKLYDINIQSNMTLYNLEPEEMLLAHKDVEGQLRAAFIFHIKNQQDACQEILNIFFLKEDSVKNTVGSILDKTVIAISHGLLNDIPAGDPRWLRENGSSIGLGSSSSIQIEHQLQDKQQAHNMFLNFLQQTGLWERFKAVSVDTKTVATTHVLADHAEFLTAIIAFKNLSTDHGPLMQDMIEFVVNQLYDEPYQNLTKTDMFYREIANVTQGFWGLVEKCEEFIYSDSDPSQQIEVITETNVLIMEAIDAVMRFRQQKATFFSPSLSIVDSIEYSPWTLNQGKYGLYTSLEKQRSITLKHGARVASEGCFKTSLYDQYVSLIDVMIDAWKCHVKSIRSPSKAEILMRRYQTQREKLIIPLVEDQVWERAALIAEKYLDFKVLIVICENTKNQLRLNDYMERFKDDNFAQYLFNWYIQENKQGKLLAHCQANIQFSTSSDLTKFLGTEPALSWLQYLFEGKYEKVSHSLKYLADTEKDLLTRKKSMLSFSKLSSLVANDMNDTVPFIDEINQNLEQISYQEEIPDSVLSAYGYDTLHPPVLDAAELIQLYISDEHSDITEYEYKKALELLMFVPNQDNKEELIRRIWSSAILKDNWSYKEVSSPMEIIQHTMFYKIVDLALTMGCTIEEILPPMEVLLSSPKLEKLADNTNFQYLIKVAYDHFYNSHSYEK